MFKANLPEIPGQQRLEDMTVSTKIIRKGNYVYPALSDWEGNEDYYTESLKLALEGVSDTYMNRCYSCEVSDKIFEAAAPNDMNQIMSLRHSIHRAINRISRIRNFDKEHTIEFHLSSNKYAAHITLIDDRADPKINAIVGHLYIADDQMESVLIGIFQIVPDGSRLGMGDGALVLYGGMTVYFLSKKYKIAEKLANSHRDVCKFGVMGSFELYLLEYMLYQLIDQLMIGEPSIDYRYLPIETWMFGVINKDTCDDGESHTIHTVFTWTHEEDINGIDTVISAPAEVLPDTNPNYPRIDFNDKEWNFIDGYCNRNGLLDVPTNIIPYFTNPRYGNVYTMNIYNTSVDSVVISYNMNTETNTMQLFISESINDGASIVLVADFNNIDRFDNNSFRKIRKCVLYTNFDHMFASLEDLINVSNLLKLDINNTTLLIKEVLEFFIIIHDRPERSRMIKGVKATSAGDKKKNKNGNNHESTEVVWRILKPVKAAKEYVKTMNTGSKSMIYTLEAWPRTGHPRHLKSGKVIWIDSTTCRRRDDLLTKDKDIKIKL